MEPFDRVIFSGEYADKLFNGWVEGALESAVRNLVNIWPTKYDAQFGESMNIIKPKLIDYKTSFLVERKHFEEAKKQWS